MPSIGGTGRLEPAVSNARVTAEALGSSGRAIFAADGRSPGIDEESRVHAAVSLARWYEQLADPVFSERLGVRSSVWLNRFADISPEIAQPALDEHVVAMHLGGPKQIGRKHRGRLTRHDVRVGSITLMPAFQENLWTVAGPVDFVHLTFGAGLLHCAAVEELDRDPSDIELTDSVGVEDPLIEHLLRALLDSAGAKTGARLCIESILVVLAVTLLKRHSSLDPGAARSHRGIAKGGLASWQLRRVLDYMAASVAVDLRLQDFVELTGLSRAQFYRAFKQSTGRTPQRYLTRLRIQRAKLLLQTSKMSTEQVAAAVGFDNAQRFSAVFKKHVGVVPKVYRLSCES